MSRTTTRLVAAPAPPPPAPRSWPEPVAALIAGPHSGSPETPWQPYLVHGGPGTGKTSLLIDTAVARLAAGADPESVLVLTGSRRAAAEVREQITARLLTDAGGGGQTGAALREPLVRTVHSYAFAVLRLQASDRGNPPPRLITGSEQDVVLRELLAGDIEDGAGYWPESLRPALGTDGFAQALRDLLMRSAQRGLGPEDLRALGRRHGRPEWVAAGRAYAQYEQTMLLRAAVGHESPEAMTAAVDPAELVGSALSALLTDAALMAGQRARIRVLLVDDAQHLDPQAARLVQLIGTGTDLTVIAADPDQSVFSFRGASDAFVDELPTAGTDRDLTLTVGHRSTGRVAAAGAALAARLPGARRHPYPVPAGGGPQRDGHAAVRVFASAAKEATAVADTLRRAHLFDQVPWSEMAVIVRSVPRALPALRRALSSAGVPVVTPASDLPLHRQRAVEAFMLALQAADDDRPLPPEETTTLLSGPIGGADPGQLRRLRRGLRRLAGDDAPDSLTLLAEALADPQRLETALAGLTDFEVRPLAQTAAVVQAARRAERSGAGIEETLWAAWQASGLERTWTARSLRGDRSGEQADRDLDAVMALFEAAAAFADTAPAAGIGGFLHYLRQLQIPRESRVPTVAGEAVSILSAHSAAGREWEVVAVAGVLDGLWPSLRSRGSVLSTPALMDLLDGVAPDGADTVSRGAVMLAEERRLLLVACSRARSRLLVTAVEDGTGDASPSRFVPEIADALGGYGDGADEHGETPDQVPVDSGIRRLLALPSMVAELRSVLADPDAAGPRRGEAARLLARLAAEQVPGADPADWYGLAPVSTEAPLWRPEDGPLALSPSNVESLSRCSLRWMLERYGGRDGDAAQAVTGTLVHTLAQAVAGRLDHTEVTAALRAIWDRVDSPAAWFSARELARAETMLVNFRQWLTTSRAELSELGVEVGLEAAVPAGEPGDELPVTLIGRIDRLETDRDGRPVVVDVKTGKTVITAADAQEHPQLAAYQLALLLGGVEGVPAGTAGGGRLVYVAQPNQKTGAAQRSQDPLTPEQVDEWIGVVRSAARAGIGPRFTATVNPGCTHCALQTSCPAQLRGKAVTDD
ncbi:ATP-dependent helicase [Gordonia sp. VNK21]|uniref:ATP-dependent helicase n=1 Tax=Gordonia sp. VNK21 TaxID=3382483 RepID=UPI0038D3FE7B